MVHASTRQAFGRGQRGYSITELMVTMTILMLVTSIMATGAPAALRSYMGVVDASNAQILLSTTATRLRDELSMADPNQLDLDSKELESFVSLETGYSVSFVFDNEGYLCKKEWGATTTEGSATPTYLVPHKTAASAQASQQLRATYDSIEYENGIFTVKNLRVGKVTPAAAGDEGESTSTKPNVTVVGGAKYDELKIRVLAVPQG